ncbi:MAG TPA: alpha/beta hydrolase [Pseudonocardiaceae bacterium]|jgi:non-heme chloroperoxidase|nr:alpha/beta hydrolase [Pseudonocardiaceae bacterium]
MPTVAVNEESALWYSDWGTGQPVLFLASAAVSSRMWDYQRIHLVDKGMRAIAYDRRGHGRSDDPGGGYDYDTLADDLAKVIDHLDLHDLVVVAHSMGGGEIVRYLTRHGADRISKIVLAATTLPFPLRTDDNPDGVDGALAEQLRNSWKRDYPRWIEDNAGPFFGVGLPGCEVSEGLVTQLVADMLTTSLQSVVECNRSVVETDFRAELARITVPTLILHGDTDASIPVERSGRRQAELIASSELRVYENAPHGLFLTHQDRFNTDLVEFVNS